MGDREDRERQCDETELGRSEQPSEHDPHDERQDVRAAESDDAERRASHDLVVELVVRVPDWLSPTLVGSREGSEGDGCMRPHRLERREGDGRGIDQARDLNAGCGFALDHIEEVRDLLDVALEALVRPLLSRASLV